uniref:Uncharacterized protein n=1 Tax=Kalanchoe fedtschenkoi TaxID=63787 RepID=A0A7N0TH05_KALFE
MNRNGHEHQSSSSSCDNNWLAFTLSNSTPLTLFNSAAAAGEGPKLEDFLGAATGSNSNSNRTVVDSQAVDNRQQQQQHNQQQMYEEGSELKTIAASFFARHRNGSSSSGVGRQSRDRQQMVAVQQPAAKKTVETFGHRTSVFRGVTRHRWTGRYEAHLWDNSCRREGQSRKGRQGNFYDLIV